MTNVSGRRILTVAVIFTVAVLALPKAARADWFITPFVGVLLLNEPYSWAKAMGSVMLLISIYQITKKQ